MDAGEPARLDDPVLTAGAAKWTRFRLARASPPRAPRSWIGEPGESHAPVIAELFSELSEMPCRLTERPVGDVPAAIARPRWDVAVYG